MLIPARTVKLTTRTDIEVRRTLRHASPKMIGPRCFIDDFGPGEQTEGMQVAAHPRPHRPAAPASFLYLPSGPTPSFHELMNDLSTQI